MDELVRVVHLYYQRGLTQREIAERSGVSSMTVSRLLKRAEIEGLVRITIRLPVTNDPVLEEALKARLAIPRVFVTRQPAVLRDAIDDGLTDHLGRSAALFLDAILRDGITLGVASGRTVARIVDHIPPRSLKDATVVQVMGGLDLASSQNAYNILQVLSERLGAEGHYFSGPVYVSSEAGQAALFEQVVRSGLRGLWQRSDLCLSGIGSATVDNPYERHGLLTAAEIARLVAAGAVGDICGHYFDLGGTFVHTGLERRVNAMPLEDMYTLNDLVVVAGGPSKVRPIIGLARAGLPLTLITDDATARSVLDDSRDP
jgi:DNA-binding transcriptional regulator LsrR (DeoR family)